MVRLVAKTEAELLKRFFEETPPLPQLLATTRSRRVGRGYRIDSGEEETHPVTGRKLFQEKGPLHFVSKKDPVPLTEVEEAVLCWAGCGPNGIINWDIAVYGGYHELTWLAGKTVPTPGNSLATDLLVISDWGTYIYSPTRERSKRVEIEGEADYYKVLKWWREGIKKISDKRPDIDWATTSSSAPNASLFGPYQYNINKPGSAWFIPITDVGWLYLSILVNIFDWWHLYIIDDRTGEPAGLKQWVKPGYLEFPVALSSFEQFLFQVEMYPAGSIVQNIRLACEAIGLGNWVFCGYFDDVLMGAFPDITKGLGFQAEINPKAMTASGQVAVFGLPGIKEATYVPSPKYKNGEAAIKALLEEKYGPGGTLAPEDNWMFKVRGPYKPEVARAIVDHPRNKIPDWAVEAAIAYVDYCVEHYGRCPVTFNPMQCNFGITVHHLDEEFYERFYVEPGLTPQILEHFERWH